MPLKVNFLSVVAALCLLGLSSSAHALPARSVSASRQFIVYGSDPALCGVVGDVGERTKARLLTLLQTRDDWKTPIVVNAQFAQANFPEAPPVALRVSQTGFGLKLQLDLTLGADLQSAQVERAFLQAILLELMYRARPNLPADAPYMEPPAWLLDGILASTTGQDPLALVEIVRAVVTNRKVMPLDEFLSQRSELLDSPSRRLFFAYSFALISLLIDGPEGQARLTRYIADLPDSPNDVAADLRSHFPVLGDSGNTTERAWLSNIMRISEFNSHQLLSIAETERQLDELLHLHFGPSGQSCRVEDYKTFLSVPSRVPVLNRLSFDLMTLATQSNPISRPIIFEYQKIASALARNKTRHIARELDQLTRARKEMGRRMQQIDNYLNWFEATQSQTRSGTFTQLLRVADKSNEPRPHRRDAISVYLDVLETQFQ